MVRSIIWAKFVAERHRTGVDDALCVRKRDSGRIVGYPEVTILLMPTSGLPVTHPKIDQFIEAGLGRHPCIACVGGKVYVSVG